MTVRQEQALALKLQGFTYQAIGDEMGISKQRAQQLVAPPKQIRNRVVQLADGYCQDCSIRVGNSGHVHHKGSTAFDDFNDIDNLVLLCMPCHRTAHRGDTRIPSEPAKANQGDMQHTCTDGTTYKWTPRVKTPRLCPRCKASIR